MIDTDDATRARLRKLWRQWHEGADDRHRRWHEAEEAAHRAWRQNPGLRSPPYMPPPRHIPMPRELAGLTCGAKTRAGTPCKRTDIYNNGRCKFHGGLSTGPTTPEGKAIASRNAKRTP